MSNLLTIMHNGQKIPIPAIKGDPGITPHIGDNGNWWLGDEDTGVSAGGGGSTGGEAWELLVDDTLAEAVTTYSRDFDPCKKIKALIAPVLSTKQSGWKKIVINNTTYSMLNQDLSTNSGMAVEVNNTAPYIVVSIGDAKNPANNGVNGGGIAFAMKPVGTVTNFGVKTPELLTAGTIIKVWGVKE